MVLWAINKCLYEDSIKKGLRKREAINKSKCFSIGIMEQFGFIFEKGYLKPQYREFYGFDRMSRDVTNTQWTFVKEYEKQNGIRVRSFFTPSKKGINKETQKNISDDQKHMIAQDILLAQFIEGTLKINYHNIPIEVRNFHIKMKKDPEEYLEQTKDFNELFELGFLHKSSRRADMLIEFVNWNEKFGKGIAFEIANTEQIKSLKEKEQDWNKNHYSYVALDIKQFNINDESLKSDLKIKVTSPFDLHKEKESGLIHCQHIDNDKKLKELDNYYQSFKEKIRTEINESILQLKDELNNISSDSFDLRESIKSEQAFINTFNDRKEEIINDITKELSEDINNKAVEIVQRINDMISEKIDIQLMNDIKDKLDLVTDFKVKLDREIFNSCERNRRYCLNISKHKLEEYACKISSEMKDKLIKEIKNEV